MVLIDGFGEVRVASGGPGLLLVSLHRMGGQCDNGNVIQSGFALDGSRGVPSPSVVENTPHLICPQGARFPAVNRREDAVGGAEIASGAGVANDGFGHETEVHGLQRLTAAFEDGADR